MSISLSSIQLHDTFKHRATENLNLDDLIASIKEHGLIHPPTVRFVSGRFELIAGFRRFNAIRKLGWKSTLFNAIEMDDKEAMSVSLTENAGRKDLTPIEEARAFQTAIEKVGMLSKEVAAAAGKSESYISNRIKLLTLDESARDLVDQGKITPGHAEHALFILQDYPKLQARIAKNIVKEDQDIMTAKARAKNELHAQKRLEDLQKAIKAAKYKNCPNCGRKASAFSYYANNRFACENNNCHPKGSTWEKTEWSPITGKVLNERATGTHNAGIKAAQEARARMEAPRTAYWDMTLEKAQKCAYRKALELLKKATAGKESISVSVGRERIDITAPGDYYTKVEFSLRGSHFQVTPIQDKGFVTTKIPWGDPTKKIYERMAELLDYPEQLRHTGKPVKDGPGKILSSKAPLDKRRAGSSGLITEKQAVKAAGGAHA